MDINKYEVDYISIHDGFPTLDCSIIDVNDATHFTVEDFIDEDLLLCNYQKEQYHYVTCVNLFFYRRKSDKKNVGVQMRYNTCVKFDKEPNKDDIIKAKI